jgi:hypothetical protein
MMAVGKSSGDENPCRKTRFTRSKPPSENPLGADPVACPDGTRGSARTSVPVSRQPVISAAREWYPCMCGTRRELTSNHTGNWSESWQSARKCQCGRYGKRPRRNLGDRIFAASVCGRTSGCAHSKELGWTLGAKVHNCSVTVWRNGSMLSGLFCAHIPPCVCS